MKQDKELINIIEALGKHEDSSAVGVLKRLGTNCSNDEVRRLTAKALIDRNTHDSLSVVILEKGKGINDMNTNVAMSAINDLLSLAEKSEALRILEDTAEMHSDEEVRETARSVKSLMTMS